MYIVLGGNNINVNSGSQKSTVQQSTISISRFTSSFFRLTQQALEHKFIYWRYLLTFPFAHACAGGHDVALQFIPCRTCIRVFISFTAHPPILCALSSILQPALNDWQHVDRYPRESLLLLSPIRHGNLKHSCRILGVVVEIIVFLPSLNYLRFSFTTVELRIYRRYIARRSHQWNENEAN